MDFARVISLGYRCRTTHNIQRHFDIKGGYPFDWYILTLRGLIRSLRDGLDETKFYNPDVMVEVLYPDGRIKHIKNQHYDVLHVHSFPNDSSGGMCRDWRGLILNARDRFRYTANKLRALKDHDEPVLFVRERHPDDQASDLLSLKSSLTNILGATRFYILAVNYCLPSEHDGIEFVPLTENQEQDWKGDEVAWSNMFIQTGHRLVK